jgi:hypothetical protein
MRAARSRGMFAIGTPDTSEGLRFPIDPTARPRQIPPLVAEKETVPRLAKNVMRLARVLIKSKSGQNLG